MKVKSCRFSVTPAGVVESVQDYDVSSLANKQATLLFCDVLAVDTQGVVLGAEHNTTIAHLVEKWIFEALSKHGSTGINVTALQEALQYANQRMLLAEVEGISKVAVSAVMLTAQRPPNAETHELLIAGVGDCRVYDIKPDSAELVFVDPHAGTQVDNSAPDGRLAALKNAIGNGDNIQVHTHRYPLGVLKRCVVVSQGLHQQCFENEIWQMGLKPHDPAVGAKAVLENKANAGNALSILAASYGAIKDPGVSGTDSAASAGRDRDRLRARRRQRAMITLAVSLAAVAAFLCTATLQNSRGIPAGIASTTWEAIDDVGSDSDDEIIGEEWSYTLVAAMDEYSRQNEATTNLLQQVHANLQQPVILAAAAGADLAAKPTATSDVPPVEATPTASVQATDVVDSRILALEKTLRTLEQLLEAQGKSREEELAERDASLLAAQRKMSELASDFAELNIQKEGLEQQINSLRSALAAAASYQDQYAEEHRQRLSQQESLEAMSRDLQAQREWATKIEHTCSLMTQEVELLRADNDRLRLERDARRASEGLAATSVKPMAVSELHSPGAADGTRRIHFVAKGETLRGIATRYYGSSGRWQEIYEANKDLIADKNRIKVGTPLVIP